MNVFDTLTNFVASLGAGSSKKAFDQFTLTGMDDRKLEAMYRGDFLARKVVDVPVRDVIRPWRSWQATPEQITAIEGAEKHFALRAELGRALIWARLYGGSVMIIGAGSPDPRAPLNAASVSKGGLRYLRALPRKLIGVTEVDLDPASAGFGAPKMYTLQTSARGQIEVHPSRVVRFVGAPRPDLDTNNEGWGDSILQVVYDAVHNAALAMAGTSELVHEAKVDIIKIKNLGAMLSSDAGTKVLLERFGNAARLKSINNTLLLDGEDEHTREQANFAGLPDVIRVFLEIVSAAADIPVTRLLGTSAKGLNATGEGDTRNYYDFLDGWRVENLGPAFDVLDELLWRHALGSVPADAYYEFNPLWQMSEKELAELAKTKADVAKVLSSLGWLPEEPMARALLNQLIEDGTYPGLEPLVADLLASDEPIVPEDLPDDDVQPGGNDPRTRRKSAQADRAPRDAAVDWWRTGSDPFADLDGIVDNPVGAGKPH